MSEHINARRKRAEEAWQTEHIVLIGAGTPIPVPGGMDQVHHFEPHPDHYWLTGHRTAGAVLAYDAREGWRDFTPDLTDDDSIWEGVTTRPGEPISGLAAWLEQRKDRPKALLGAPSGPLKGVTSDRTADEVYAERLLHARRVKDSIEIERMRRASDATARGFAHAREFAKAGVTEREIEIELQAECFRAGGEKMGYHNIVGSGTNAAVLHFSPSDRRVQQNEFVLIDAGCQVEGYTADVTRTFVVGTPSTQQTELHGIVKEALLYGNSQCVPGKEWRELHLECALRMTKGLVSLGILRGDPQGLVERDVHAMFFPHGLGHLVGLGVRDASGYLPGRERSDRFGLAFLRMDLPLESGYITTVEPGLYFIEPLLRDPNRRERFAKDVNWDEVDRWIGIGGVRLEDDILVTDSGPVNLTESIPLAI
ncbi:MAG: aminopeptidase P N-terminal domain-containing protein [Phycisphaerales bacterium JB061]